MSLRSLLKQMQPKVLQILENSYKHNRLSHAYLFAGAKGTLKKKMAYHFAMMLYCKHDEVCYECDTCRQILNNNHLNVFYIEPTGQNIKKEQILALQEEFSKTSQIEGPRIYIINHADKMSTQAANSLLKFIEEPTSEETYGILITEQKDSILSTIISRSIILNFDMPKKTEVKRLLLDSGLDEKIVDVLTYITNNEDEAKVMVLEDEFNDLNNLFNKFILQLSTNAPIGLFYRANANVLNNKKTLLSFLNLIEGFYRDTYEFIVSEKVLHFTTYLEEIKAFSAYVNANDVLESLKLILELRKKLGYNVNTSLLINQLLINLRGGKI